MSNNSNSFHTNNSGTPTMSDEVVVHTTKSKQQSRRSKASRQKHQDAFRQKKNKAALEEIHRGARERTFEGIDEQLAILSQLHLSKFRTTAQLPVTTRGIGFLATEMFSFLEQVIPRVIQSTGCTSLTLYKVGLLQFSAQQFLAEKLHSDLTDYEFAPQQLRALDFSQIELAKTTTNKTLMPFSLVADITGLITIGDTFYLTHVPPHGCRQIDVPMVEGPTSPKRQAVSTSKLLPNPYYVTLQSARDVVEALSDVTTPLQVREYFKSNNPIPGAKWNNETVLVNPNELFPLNWLDTLPSICKTYIRTVSGAAGKLSSIIGAIPLDGKGDAASLVSEYQFKGCFVETVAPRSELNFGREARIYRSMIDLEQSRLLRGGLALVGEYPQPCDMLPVPPDMAPRYPTISTRAQEFSWENVFLACCQKR